MIYCCSPFEAGVRGLCVAAAPVIILQPVMTKVKESKRDKDASPVGSTCLSTHFYFTYKSLFSVMLILFIVIFQLVAIFSAAFNWKARASRICLSQM